MNRKDKRTQENLVMRYLIQASSSIRNQFSFYSKSHSCGTALFAISTNPVGCDLEQIHMEWTLKEIERRLTFYLTKQEAAQVISAKEPQRDAILAWTRKESYFKVHQQRKVSQEYDLASSVLCVSGESMEFVSVMLGDKMIATCYHQKGNELEWIPVDIM